MGVSNHLLFRFVCLCVWLAGTIDGTVMAQTRPASGPSAIVCRLALVADPHISADAAQAEYAGNFQRVIEDVNHAGVDAVLLAGDLTQSFQPAAAKKFMDMAQRFHAPRWCVAGNHDVGDKPLPGKPGTLSEGRLARYQEAVGPLFFAAQIRPGVRLVGITASLFDSKLGSETRQWDFLRRELDMPHAGVTLLLSHYPPFVESAEEQDGYFNLNTASRSRLLNMLKGGGVNAVLSGHLHRPVTLQWQGIAILGAPAVSFGLPKGRQGVGWRLVEVHADGEVNSEFRYLAAPAATEPAREP